MKNNLSKIVLIAIITSFFLACSVTKRVPSNERLLLENEIIINNKKETNENITNLLYQQPNSNVLGYRLRLQMYNAAKVNPDSSYQAWLDKHRKSERFLTNLLSAKQVDRLGTSFFVSGLSRTLKDLGEAPVLYNNERTKKSLIRLKNYYFNQGYFNTKVSYTLDSLHPKKIKANYHVTTGKPYVYDSISVQVQSAALDSLYKTNKRPSILKKGDTYNAAKLDEERDRITTFIRNNGGYDFQRTYINYVVDTLKNNHTADVFLTIDDKTIKQGDTLTTEPFKLYKISSVNLYTSNVAEEATQITDTVTYKNINIYSKGTLSYKPKVLRNAIFIDKDTYFSDTRRLITSRSLSNLKVFNYPTIEYVPDTTDSLGQSLIANVTLNPRKRIQFNPTIDLSHSTIQDFGIEGSVGFLFRNLFKGAEILDVGIRGNIGSSASRYRSNQNTFFDIFEYGANVKLTFPRFLFFSNQIEKIIDRTSFPNTTLSIGFFNQQNIGLDKQNVTGVYNYTWSYKRRNTITFDVFNLQFVRNMNPNNYFNIYRSSYNRLNEIAQNTNTNPAYVDANGNLIIGNPGTDAFITDVLNRSTPTNNDQYNSVLSIDERKTRLTENNLILASNIVYTYSDRFNYKDQDFISFRTKIESAGSLLNLLTKSNAKVNTAGKTTILDVAYSQYIKGEVDFVKYIDLGRQKIVALRAFAGLALPVGNSDNIPFSRSYFAGGTNDNRAWQSYRLGPGRSGGILDFNEANMKLAFNAEYRFNVTGPWNVALFADAGNIWNAFDNVKDEEMTFNGLKSLQDIALGTGLGIRYDFSFFVIRCDLGFKTYNPANNPGNKWFKEWNLSKTVLNVGINYPF
ncbi:BamA/TamA family outer membrane protein [Myroides sp. JBRI-B21084]|uniref:translocation and assembly module lipoprotein TamL n=1 Tax=Myroides sp. JBRI-B21084 TaxID=3119977 RepID=UPI0026E19AC3|nr:BamA/TamA family outer membrane protein [Paenimyroides cloacae]WKW46672.1 BamA/TamA family outer membrane protein [Paenimyroides cloacae]